MRLSLYYPRSFRSLLLSAFALVALPLLAGIATMTFTLDRIAIEGRRSVDITAEVTAATQRLAQAGVALQRAAGQYFVLEDPTLKERLDQADQRFSNAVIDLQAMPIGEGGQRRLAAVADQESALVTRLRAARSPAGEAFEAFKPAFDDLHEAVAGVADEVSQLVQRRAGAMSEAAARVERAMIGQALAVVLLSLFLAALLARLVTRPVQHLAQAIRRLGENDLATVAAVKGPRDMVYLGEQLDWLRRRLVDLEDQKQRFLRHVSHELKTPLTALWEAVQLLADKVAGGLTGQQEEIVRIMDASARELKRRIEDLLRYNEAIRQPESAAPMVVALEPLVQQVAARLDLSLRAKDLHLATAVSEVQLWADRGRLDTALENLIANAIRFSPNGGVIEVAADTIGGQARITVCDQGPGVSPEDREYIFQAFYQGTNQPRGALRGSGLGLAIARTNIEAQGGELVLSPPQDGRGACFRITLPCAEPDGTNAT